MASPHTRPVIKNRKKKSIYLYYLKFQYASPQRLVLNINNNNKINTKQYRYRYSALRCCWWLRQLNIEPLPLTTVCPPRVNPSVLKADQT